MSTATDAPADPAGSGRAANRGQGPDPSPEARLFRAVWAPTLAYVALCLAFEPARRVTPWLAGLVVVAIGICAFLVQRWVRLRPDDLGWRVGVGIPLGVTAVGVLLVLGWLRYDLTDALGFFGGALAYMGLGLVITELRRHERVSGRLGLGLLIASFVCLVAGLVGVHPNSPAWAVAALAVSLLGLGPAALNLVSAAALRPTGWMGSHRGGLAMVGSALYAGGLALASHFGVPATFVVVLGLLALVLVLGITARSNVDVVMALVVMGALFALAPRSAAITEDVVAEPGEAAVAALGDSFMSGEGASRYYEGTNTKGELECRRAPSAYAVRLVQRDEAGTVPDDLAFLACSGATSTDLLGGDRSQGRDQLGQLRDVGRDGADVQLVLLQIGGNDALFGSIGRTCVLPGDCSDLGEAWLRQLEVVEDTLEDTYRQVDEAAGGVPVVVVPYPDPLADEPCGYSPSSPDEHQFLHDFANELNEVVRIEAREAGFHYVDTMPRALAAERQRLCDGAARRVGVNFLAANGVDGRWRDAVSPQNWFHNSLHPNARGHATMHRALAAWLADHPDLAARGDRTAPRDADVATIEEVIGTDPGGACTGDLGTDQLNDCTNDWALRQTVGLLVRFGWLALVVLAGAWLLALRALDTSR